MITLHTLIAAYAVGMVLTWAITHILDGYRMAKGYSPYPRDSVDRFWACLFWPLYWLFHRLINLAEFIGWSYDTMVKGFRRMGKAFAGRS